MSNVALPPWTMVTLRRDLVVVREAPDGLTLRVGRGLEFNVFPVAADAFYVPAFDQVLGFTGSGDQLQLRGRSALVDYVGRRVP